METFIVLLWLVSIILFFVGLIKPSLLKPITRREFTRKEAALFLGGFVVFLTILGASTTPAKPKVTEKVKIQNIQATDNPSKDNNVDYTIVSYENNKLVENYWLLINTQDKSEGRLKTLAQNFKKDKCKKDCNISIYDDKKAVDLDLEYNKIRDITEANAWKEKNYIYVADHLLGYLEFSTGTFSYYPYRDWYYKQLKQQ